MTWSITLEVVDCDATSTKLSGAKVERGHDELGFTDSAGRFDATMDDFDTLPIFRISKTDDDGIFLYVTESFSFDKAVHAGTVQTVCLSNPTTIPDGVDPNDPGESNGQPLGGNGCFIVTATTGSPESLEVHSLRAMRDRVGSVSQLGAHLIDAVYAEYEQFSPAIAAELYHDSTTRAVVLATIVRPLLAWYRLAGTLGFEHGNQSACRRAAQAAMDACPQDFDGTMIVDMLESLRSDAALPPFMPPLLRELAPRIAEFQFAPWAILEPLIRVWRAATERLDVVDQVAQWLIEAPLDRLPRTMEADWLEAELRVIADFLAFTLGRRTELGARLLSAWPDAAGALQRADLIAPTTSS